jgi:predicted DsbA family dithiol-disulfide isomerase
MTMKPLKIDFVSDVSCPWCAIGLSALEGALAELAGEVRAEIHFQPFELNPRMASGGQDITEHLSEKYGSTPAQQAQIRQTIRERGADVGFAFSPDGRGRIYNTFDAHRLLHWAGLQGEAQQLALKKALLVACHHDLQAMDEPEVLLAAALSAGLDEAGAREVLQSQAYADEVRAQESLYQRSGIQSVPAVVINDQHLISGGQPVAVFVKALREIAAQTAQPSQTGQKNA